MISYNKEQAVDDLSRNLVAFVMRLFNLDLRGAMQWVCQYHFEKQAEFFALREEIPSFGPEVDKALKEYVDLLGNDVRANYCWGFEIPRYFGDAARGLKAQEDRWVPLLPKANMAGRVYKNYY